ncbi:MAG TPA: hypothetical protein PLR18_03045 [bacterium]|nr:hypothetical protein [bacterium]
MATDEEALVKKISTLAGIDEKDAEGIIKAVVESQRVALEDERKRVIAGGGESGAWHHLGD